MQEVGITQMEEYRRELLAADGAHVVVNLGIEEVSDETRRNILSELSLFTMQLQNTLSEYGGGTL